MYRLCDTGLPKLAPRLLSCFGNVAAYTLLHCRNATEATKHDVVYAVPHAAAADASGCLGRVPLAAVVTQLPGSSTRLGVASRRTRRPCPCLFVSVCRQGREIPSLRTGTQTRTLNDGKIMAFIHIIMVIDQSAVPVFVSHIGATYLDLPVSGRQTSSPFYSLMDHKSH